MTSGDLDVPQRDARVEGGGDEAVAQRVRRDVLGDAGGLGQAADDGVAAWRLRRWPERASSRRPDRLPGGQVERPGDPRRQGDDGPAWRPCRARSRGGGLAPRRGPRCRSSTTPTPAGRAVPADRGGRGPWAAGAAAGPHLVDPQLGGLEVRSPLEREEPLIAAHRVLSTGQPYRDPEPERLRNLSAEHVKRGALSQLRALG